MSHFYATAIGKTSTQVTRTGTKNSGVTVSATSWDLGAEATMHHVNNKDQLVLSVNYGSNSFSNKRLPTIYLDEWGQWTSDNPHMKELLKT